MSHEAFLLGSMETATKVNIGGSCENFSPNSDTLRDRANSDSDLSPQPLPDVACRSALLSDTRNDADITASFTAVVRASL